MWAVNMFYRKVFLCEVLKKIVILDSLQVFLELLLLVAEMCRDHDKLLPIEAEESEGLYFG